MKKNEFNKKHRGIAYHVDDEKKLHVCAYCSEILEAEEKFINTIIELERKYGKSNHGCCDECVPKMKKGNLIH